MEMYKGLLKGRGVKAEDVQKISADWKSIGDGEQVLVVYVTFNDGSCVAEEFYEDELY